MRFWHNLRASSPIWASLTRTRERGAEIVACSPFLCPSRVLARLASLAQIGELAHRLIQAEPPFLTLLTGCPPHPFPTLPPALAHQVIQFVCRH